MLRFQPLRGSFLLLCLLFFFYLAFFYLAFFIFPLVVSPAPIAAICATIPAAIASSLVAPDARVVAIACYPTCAASAASWSAMS